MKGYFLMKGVCRFPAAGVGELTVGIVSQTKFSCLRAGTCGFASVSCPSLRFGSSAVARYFNWHVARALLLEYEHRRSAVLSVALKDFLTNTNQRH